MRDKIDQNLFNGARDALVLSDNNGNDIFLITELFFKSNPFGKLLKLS